MSFKKLERLVVRNFQKHAKFVLELDPKTTILVGSSDTGKSSVLRALKWLAFNRPGGDSFIKRGQEDCFVRLEADGHRVSRVRSKGANEYRLDGNRYAAFGTDVPESIADLLNLAPENFAFQHDAVWWFADTAGQVGKNLNRIVDLEAVDRTLANLAAASRRAKATADVARERLGEAQGRLRELAWVEGADRDLKEIEYTLVQSQEASDRASRIASILEDVSQTRQTLSNATQAKASGLLAVSKAEAATQAASRVEKLEEILYQIGKHGKDSSRIRADLAKAEAELKKAEAGRCPLCGRT